MAAHEDREAGAGAAAALLAELQDHTIQGYGVVPGDDAPLLMAEDGLELSRGDGHEGRMRVGGRAAEGLVVGGEEALREVTIGGRDGPDPRDAEIVNQRSCRVRLARSLRPRACGEWPRMCSMPRACSARPTCVRRVRSGALPEVDVWTAQCARSVYRAPGNPCRANTADKAVMIARVLYAPSTSWA